MLLKARKQLVAQNQKRVADRKFRRTGSGEDRQLLRRMGLIFLLVVLAMAQDRPTFRVKVDMVVLQLHHHRQQGPLHQRTATQGFPHPGGRYPAKAGHVCRGQPAAAGGGRGRLHKPDADYRAKANSRDRSDAFVGTNVFVLFDTSNYMYRGFVYASDAIADFVRGLDRADSVAVYTYSRNLSRAALAQPGAQRGDHRGCATRWRATIRRCTTRCC